jgi:hypothetical protein
VPHARGIFGVRMPRQRHAASLVLPIPCPGLLRHGRHDRRRSYSKCAWCVSVHTPSSQSRSFTRNKWIQNAAGPSRLHDRLTANHTRRPTRLRCEVHSFQSGYAAVLINLCLRHSSHRRDATLALSSRDGDGDGAWAAVKAQGRVGAAGLEAHQSWCSREEPVRGRFGGSFLLPLTQRYGLTPLLEPRSDAQAVETLSITIWPASRSDCCQLGDAMRRFRGPLLCCGADGA